MKSIRANPRSGAPEGDERIRTAARLLGAVLAYEHRGALWVCDECVVTRPAVPLTTVWFEETGEQRDVLRYCVRCARGPHGGEEIEIVSPTGIAHCQRGDEFTLCGINATGLDWWWRL